MGSNANIYGGVDWVAMAMNANETADLTDPAVHALPQHSPNLCLHFHHRHSIPLWEGIFSAVHLAQRVFCGT